jgi:uncharacterized protein (DUF2252 family)
MNMPHAKADHDADRVSGRERAATGKLLRGKVPRTAQGLWRPHDGSRDPIDLLHKADSGRIKKLIPIRYGRMLPSPFAFFRGAATVMAADLARTESTGLTVQACGDCHLLNFGGFATPERSVIFDINDFDETLPAPWEWDVKRLVTSVVLAARLNGLADHRGRDCAIACARRYREHMHRFSKMDPLHVWYTETTAEEFLASLGGALRRTVYARIKQASEGSGSEFDMPKISKLNGETVCILDKPPLIFHPENESESPSAFEELFHAYRQSLSDDRRYLIDRYRLVDAAIKVVGVGSVGRRCWIALMLSEGGNPLLLQFKEAARSVLEPFTAESAYSHQGQRVVAGQRLLQPVSDIFLGWTSAANGREFYVRKLHDAKIKPLVETFNAEMLEIYAEACGWVLARAHAKASGLSAAISGYLGASNDTFDKAMGQFATAYADQTERDHATLEAAVKRGRIEVDREHTPRMPGGKSIKPAKIAIKREPSH